MKKALSVTLALLMTLSLFVSFPAQKAEAAVINTYVGDLYVTKLNNLWTAPYTNTLMLVTPGNTLSGVYYDRVYAVYDSAAGGYVVQSKVPTHVSAANITVADNAIGLAMSYQPQEGSVGADYARKNWVAWQQIRVGDVLKIGSGIDLTNKTVSTSGTWGTDFVSNAKIGVYTNRNNALPKTALTGKKIVALGDSVTAGGGWVDAIEERYNCEIINSGTPGDRTDEALERFDSVVAAHNPDLVFIKFCLNDCIQYTITTNTLPQFKANLKTLYNRCKALGAKVVFMNTNSCKISSFADYSRYDVVGGFTNYFYEFEAAIGEVAAELGCHFIDIYSQWSGKDYNSYLMDTVHPNAAGYELDKTAIFNYLDVHIDELLPDSSLPSAKTNYAAATNGGSYMYPTSIYPGDSGYYSYAYYGDNQSQGGAYMTGKLNDGLTPADSYPNSSNTDWAVYFTYQGTPEVTFKLSTAAYLNSLSVKYWDLSAENGMYGPVGIGSVAISQDGESFTAVSDYAATSSLVSGRIGSTVVRFNSIIKAKYVKFTVAAPVSGDRFALGEVEIWGDTSLPQGAQAFELVEGSAYALKDGYLSAPNGAAKASEVAKQFICTVVLYDAKGVALTDTAYVGTGCTVARVDSAGNTPEYATVTVSGDIDGDAFVTNTDYVVLKSYFKGRIELSGCYNIAGDIDSDKAVTTNDLLIMKAVLIK